MLSAIVYSSATGSCEKYANLLSAALHIPAMPLDKCTVRKDGRVIYIGWVTAGKIVGYKKCDMMCDVAAVVQVGMSPATKELAEASKIKNEIPDGVAFFLKQGGFNMSKLPFAYKLVMKLINKKIAASLSKKENRSPEEEATYRMAVNGIGEPAAWDISDILAWANKDSEFSGGIIRK